MKKMFFGVLAAASLTLGSCGETLLTDAQVAAKIEEGVAAQRAAVVAAADAECQASFAARVEAEAQRIVEDTNAMKAAEKAKMDEEKKAAAGSKKKKK